MQTIEIKGHKFEVLKIYTPNIAKNAELYKTKINADVIIRNTADNNLYVCYYIPEVTYIDIERTLDGNESGSQSQ